VTEKIYDVVIVGGGPAGLTSGIYCARETLDTVLLEKSMTGGIPAIVDLIENYPGFPEGITGPELMARTRVQAEKFGLQINEFNEVKALVPGGKSIRIQTDGETYQSRAVIIASGGEPRRLGLPSEKALLGRGVSYCATCDGPLYKGADLIVVGGGDAAVQEALFLTKFARNVTIIHRRDQLRAQPILQERAFNSQQIEVRWDSVVHTILGDTAVNGIEIENVKTGQCSRQKADGVFIFIGWIPNTDFVKTLLRLDKNGHLITDIHLQTSIPGIYAVGDVRAKEHRQIANAVGDGAVGALSASEYISELKANLNK
jgi:thioredoxin reductase (NADPH)